MPFAVWCTTCPKPTIIGQGVRFNAEKKKVDAYLSTPIYSFRMKHVVCGGIIEIRTDPKNTAYVVTEGGKKRDLGEDKELEGEFTVKTEEERERLRNDAFAALEGKVADKRQAEKDHSRIRDIASLRQRDWADPYAESQRLRRTFRAERKEREQRAEQAEALKDKLSLGIELLDETEDDRRRAELVDFGDGEDDDVAIIKARTKSLFEAAVADDVSVEKEKKEKEKEKHKDRKQTKADEEAARRSRRKKSRRKEALDLAAAKKAQLQKEIQGNTLAAIDPFQVAERDWGASANNNSSSSSSISKTRLVPSIRRKLVQPRLPAQVSQAEADPAETMQMDSVGDLFPSGTVLAGTATSLVAAAPPPVPPPLPPPPPTAISLVNYDSDE